MAPARPLSLSSEPGPALPPWPVSAGSREGQCHPRQCRPGWLRALRVAVPAGLRRWLSSPAPVPRICVVGSGPAGFYTAQHILKVPGWDLAVSGAQQLRGWLSGLLAPLQPGLCFWGAAWGSPDPTGSSWGSLVGVGAAAFIPALPLGRPFRIYVGFIPSDFSRSKSSAGICLAQSCCHPAGMTLTVC